MPFVLANATDVTETVHTPPLYGVARAALDIYQLTADYRYQLFMSGQEQLVAINGEAPDVVGAGSAHSMIGTEGVTPDLKYVSPTCKGIESHKVAIDNYREEAALAGARLLHKESRSQESGEARRLRNRSEVASLQSVVMVSCAMLEKSLKNTALILGQNPDDVVVTAPKDILDTSMSMSDLQQRFGPKRRQPSNVLREFAERWIGFTDAALRRTKAHRR